MKYSYFPGCSLEHNAAAYHRSALAVADILDLEMEEVDDWNCCGATEYISLNMTAAFALIARNLAQAAKSNGDPAKGAGLRRDLVAPCSACYLNLSKCDHYMRDSPELATKINLALAAGGLSYRGGTIRVRHLVDVIYDDVGCQELRSHVVKPMHGLRVAPYYGCLISRPGLRTELHDPEYPTVLDSLLECLGMEVVDFPLIVGIDSKGNGIYDKAKWKSA